MNYFYIYSAGGGAGDWNGIKRIWKTKMPPAFKQNVLLKFGDVYFNHSSSRNLIKPRYWQSTNDIRQWLSDNVNDPDIHTKTDILLDCGTSKIVNFVATQISSSPDLIIKNFDYLINHYGILDKYADVIKHSKIKEAVTLDIPNSFKIRTQSQTTKTLHFDSSHQAQLLTLSAAYANGLYQRLDKDASAIMTTINGSWTVPHIESYLSLLDYSPVKIAVGGITGAGASLTGFINQLNHILPFNQLDRIHFLGAGGIKSARIIKSIYNGANASVDNSTPMNRAIDGSTNGASQSGYFDYETCGLTRINPSTAQAVLSLHRNADQPLFSMAGMEDVVDKILLHQSGNSSEETYNARATLSIHNHDVFRRNAI
jgi:hypothetical protein